MTVPSAAALIRACLCAIIAPVILVPGLVAAADGEIKSFLGALPMLLWFGVPIAAVHALALWLPAFFWLSRARPLPWLHVAALGFVCGALPFFLIALASDARGEADSAAFAIAFFGSCGLVGGLAFRLAIGTDNEKGRLVSEPPHR
jgi:hypothetical protein